MMKEIMNCVTKLLSFDIYLDCKLGLAPSLRTIMIKVCVLSPRCNSGTKKLKFRN